MSVLKTSLDGGATWIPVNIGVLGPDGPQGPQGPPGNGIQLKGSKPTVAQLPGSGNTTGDNWLVEADGHMYSWNGSSWVDAGNIRGPQGPPGELTLVDADARYLRQAGGTLTGDMTTRSTVTFKSPADLLGAVAGFINTQYTFAVTPSDAAGAARTNHRMSYDATNNQWTVGTAGLAAGLMSVAGAVSITGKATSAATISTDAATTLVTKGYVDAKQVVVAAKPGSASGYAEGTLIIVAP